MAAVTVHYLIQGPFDPEESRGSFSVATEQPSLGDIAAAFPFEAPEGDFHFRFKWSPSGDSRRFFWLDVVEPGQSVPVWSDGTVVAKALLVDHADAPWSYELDADAPAQAGKMARDYAPDRSLLASWESVGTADAGPSPPSEAAETGRRDSLGIPGGGAAGVAAVLSGTAGAVGKRFTAARDTLKLGAVTKSFGSFLSSAVKVASTYVAGGQPPSAAAARNLRTYARGLESRFDPSSPRHAALLRRLWAASFPHAEFSPVSAEWKTIGFQHTDPASDFRGGGLLALRALVYFSEKHSSKLDAMVHGQAERTEFNYPVAAAGINVVLGLAEVLGLRSGEEVEQVRRHYWLLFEDPHAFFQLFSIAFAYLDRTWSERGARYMEFNQVIRDVKDGVAQLLDTCPASVDELAAQAAERNMLFL